MKKATKEKPKRKPNPYSKRNLIQSRMDNEELQDALTKAAVYTNGEMSDLIRLAIKRLPLKKATR